METLIKNLGLNRALAAAGAVLLVFSAISLWVWESQRDHERILLDRHTQDVAIQASKRLQVFVESHLRVADIFAKRWATHETGDFTRKRFVEFASVVLDKLPGYAAIALVHDPTCAPWTVPADRSVADLIRGPHWGRAVTALEADGGIFLSPPLAQQENQHGFFALLPLDRGGRSLGHLLILFHSKTLVEDCFHTRIRSEFHFRIESRDRLLFQSDAATDLFDEGGRDARAEVIFGVRNQQWRLTMTPREPSHVRWTQGLSVILFGALFSLAMSVMTFFLVRRIKMYRVARDKALSEISGRQRAESGRDLAMARLAHLSQKAIAAQEEERARLSMEMHDELGQILTALRLNIGIVDARLQKEYRVPGTLLSRAAEITERATDELRRLCKGLRPPLLDDLGLAAAVRLLVDEIRPHAAMTISLHLPQEEKIVLHDLVALTTYRIIQECLTNIRRHANASAVSISLVTTNTDLTLTIADNGDGFDMSGLGAQQGCGLEGMRERANLVEGRLEIHTAPGRGTKIVLEAPLDHTKRRLLMDEGATTIDEGVEPPSSEAS